MDGIGCRWTVWEGNGNRPGLAENLVARPEGRYPRRNDRASALSGSARSLIETCQPDSQPVAERPVKHSRLRDRLDKVRVAPRLMRISRHSLDHNGEGCAL